MDDFPKSLVQAISQLQSWQWEPVKHWLEIAPKVTQPRRKLLPLLGQDTNLASRYAEGLRAIQGLLHDLKGSLAPELVNPTGIHRATQLLETVCKHQTRFQWQEETPDFLSIKKERLSKLQTKILAQMEDAKALCSKLELILGESERIPLPLSQEQHLWLKEWIRLILSLPSELDDYRFTNLFRNPASVSRSKLSQLEQDAQDLAKEYSDLDTQLHLKNLPGTRILDQWMQLLEDPPFLKRFSENYRSTWKAVQSCVKAPAPKMYSDWSDEVFFQLLKRYEYFTEKKGNWEEHGLGANLLGPKFEGLDTNFAQCNQALLEKERIEVHTQSMSPVPRAWSKLLTQLPKHNFFTAEETLDNQMGSSCHFLSQLEEIQNELAALEPSLEACQELKIQGPLGKCPRLCAQAVEVRSLLKELMPPPPDLAVALEQSFRGVYSEVLPLEEHIAWVEKLKSCNLPPSIEGLFLTYQGFDNLALMQSKIDKLNTYFVQKTAKTTSLPALRIETPHASFEKPASLSSTPSAPECLG